MTKILNAENILQSIIKIDEYINNKFKQELDNIDDEEFIKKNYISKNEININNAYIFKNFNKNYISYNYQFFDEYDGYNRELIYELEIAVSINELEKLFI